MGTNNWFQLYQTLKIKRLKRVLHKNNQKKDRTSRITRKKKERKKPEKNLKKPEKNENRRKNTLCFLRTRILCFYTVHSKKLFSAKFRVLNVLGQVLKVPIK